jgi:hypothetical protein
MQGRCFFYQLHNQAARRTWHKYKSEVVLLYYYYFWNGNISLLLYKMDAVVSMVQVPPSQLTAILQTNGALVAPPQLPFVLCHVTTGVQARFY